MSKVLIQTRSRRRWQSSRTQSLYRYWEIWDKTSGKMRLKFSLYNPVTIIECKTGQTCLGHMTSNSTLSAHELITKMWNDLLNLAHSAVFSCDPYGVNADLHNDLNRNMFRWMLKQSNLEQGAGRANISSWKMAVLHFMYILYILDILLLFISIISEDSNKWKGKKNINREM